MTIEGPERAAPGEEVTYTFTVTNRGTADADELAIILEFDAGLQEKYTQAKDSVEKSLPKLNSGQSTTTKVSFRILREGRHCIHVSVTGKGVESDVRTLCVVSQGARVSVKQSATPGDVAVGNNVRFAIDIVNEGTVDLTGIVVSSSFDAALKPLQATEVRGRQVLVNRKNDRYELTPWRFDRLGPGQSIQLDVECRADAAAANACGLVSVSSQEGARGEAEKCVRVNVR